MILAHTDRQRAPLLREKGGPSHGDFLPVEDLVRLLKGHDLLLALAHALLVAQASIEAVRLELLEVRQCRVELLLGELQLFLRLRNGLVSPLFLRLQMLHCRGLTASSSSDSFMNLV